MRAVIIFRALVFFCSVSVVSAEAKQPVGDTTSIEIAYAHHQHNVQIQASGKIEKILPDDTHGSRHQKFIVRINPSISILIAHNIDIAKRIATAKEGDTIEFYGEYEWNKKGGVVHWTHRDPNGRHVAGWLKHSGIVYQ